MYSDPAGLKQGTSRHPALSRPNCEGTYDELGRDPMSKTATYATAVALKTAVPLMPHQGFRAVLVADILAFGDRN